MVRGAPIESNCFICRFQLRKKFNHSLLLKNVAWRDSISIVKKFRKKNSRTSINEFITPQYNSKTRKEHWNGPIFKLRIQMKTTNFEPTKTWIHNGLVSLAIDTIGAFSIVKRFIKIGNKSKFIFLLCSINQMCQAAAITVFGFSIRSPCHPYHHPYRHPLQEIPSRP